MEYMLFLPSFPAELNFYLFEGGNILGYFPVSVSSMPGTQIPEQKYFNQQLTEQYILQVYLFRKQVQR